MNANFKKFSDLQYTINDLDCEPDTKKAKRYFNFVASLYKLNEKKAIDYFEAQEKEDGVYTMFYVNGIIDKNKTNALVYACRHGLNELAITMLDSEQKLEIDFSDKDVFEKSALFYAQKNKMHNVVKKIKKLKAYLGE